MSILRVTQAFALLSDPTGRVYTPGTLVEDSDPVVKGRESHFEPIEASVTDALTVRSKRRRNRVPRTETATAAPDEMRNLLAEQKAVLSAFAAPAPDADADPGESKGLADLDTPILSETSDKDA